MWKPNGQDLCMTQEFSESHVYAHYLNVVRKIMSSSLYYTHTYSGPNRTAFYHCTGDYDGILIGDRFNAGLSMLVEAIWAVKVRLSE